MKHKDWVLVAEDDAQARKTLCALLEEEGFGVIAASNGCEALDIIGSHPLEAVVLDVRMPHMDGLTVLREMRNLPRPPAVLVMTAYGNSSTAIEAMTLGAFDYLLKPIDSDELFIQLRRAIENRQRLEELAVFRAEQPQSMADEMVGSGPVMQRVYKQIGQVAITNSTVLVRGETGTGKELIAEAVHRHSTRADRRFVKVNCASIPDTLLEAELFGHERGAFTGAVQRRIGKFEFADRGSIFLDEIGELSLSTQAKLLRVLQEKTIERLGSNLTIPLDIRVLAATHRDLESAVRAGSFREDLYYRLKVVTIEAPALRERREDIPELAQELLSRCGRRLGTGAAQLTTEALTELSHREWRGNVRELEHCLEHALVRSRGGVITAEHLAQENTAPAISVGDGLPLESGLHECVRHLEKILIQRALARTNGNRTRAAELLKVNRRLLYEKLREFGL